MATDEPVPAKLAKTSAVLFADLLGFASLTEKYDLELDRIKNAERPLSLNLDTFLSLRPPNQLTEVFTEFHYSLKWQIQIAQMKHPLTAITFSDSATIGDRSTAERTQRAKGLMRRA
jgi:hypothetical protein